MEKYGFVYIWFDRKHKRYYIGCRWGNTKDKYICSSPWMKQAYKHRPKDFKRKILTLVYTNKKDLLDEEYKWLSKIKKEELGKKYYNLHNHHFGHWSENKRNKKTIGEKISLSHKSDPNWGSWSKDRKISDETKEILRQKALEQWSTEENKQILKEKSKELWKDPEYRKKQERARSKPGFYKGFTGKHTEESKQKMSDMRKGKGTSLKGKTLPHLHGLLHWYTNGVKNVKRKECPEGFWPGKIQKVK